MNDMSAKRSTGGPLYAPAVAKRPSRERGSHGGVAGRPVGIDQWCHRADTKNRQNDQATSAMQPAANEKTAAAKKRKEDCPREIFAPFSCTPKIPTPDRFRGQEKESFSHGFPFSFAKSQRNGEESTSGALDALHEFLKTFQSKHRHARWFGEWIQTTVGTQLFLQHSAEDKTIHLGDLRSLYEKGFDRYLALHLVGAGFQYDSHDNLVSALLYRALIGKGLVDLNTGPFEGKIKACSALQKQNAEAELLIMLVKARSANILKMVLQDGVNPSAFSSVWGKNALGVAESFGFQEGLRLLLEFGAENEPIEVTDWEE
jgi:hypothetical protein